MSLRLYRNDFVETTAPSPRDDGGLDGGDVAAITLGCLLLSLVIVTVVLCVLFQKGTRSPGIKLYRVLL